MAKIFSAISEWAEMVKFAHSVFALPFAVIGAFLAGRHIEGRGYPWWGQLGLVVLCMVAARSTAMTFNRIVDARIDARNPRTADRSIPAGRIGPRAAYAMLAFSSLLFLGGCGGFLIFFGNSWPLLLSVPVLAYLCAYSYAKRFTQFSHFILGSGIAFSPVAAWIAIHPETVGWEALLLMLSVTFWIGGFDIIYACLDVEHDRANGLFSLPSKLGERAALWIARACHAATVALWVVLGFLAGLGAIYAVGVGISAVLLIVENSIVRPGDYRRVNVAFFTINGIVGILFAILTIVDVLLSYR